MDGKQLRQSSCLLRIHFYKFMETGLFRNIALALKTDISFHGDISCTLKFTRCLLTTSRCLEIKEGNVLVYYYIVVYIGIIFIL